MRKEFTYEDARSSAVLRVLAAMLVAFAMLAASAMIVNASSDNDWSTARTISVNKAVTGYTAKGYDYEKDLYKFTISSDGAVAVTFSHPLQANSDTYWELYLYDSKYNQLYGRDINGNLAEHKLTEMGLPAGTYYLRVSSPSWGRAESTDTYTLNVGFTASSRWEKESNDDFATATPVQLNSDYYGTTKSGYEYENDYYSFDLSSPGIVSIGGSHVQLGSSDDCYTVKLYHSDYSEIYSYNLSGSYDSFKLVSVGLPAGRYYFSICSASYYYGGTSFTDDKYTVNVNYEASSAWEKEFNDDFSRADSIQLNTACSGTTCTSSDEDYYAFDIAEAGEYEVVMTTARQGSSDEYFYATLYDAQYNKLSSMDINGNDTQHILSNNLSAGHYYVGISGTEYYGKYTSDPYSVLVRKYTGAAADSAASAGENGEVSYSGNNLEYARISLSKDKYTYTGKELCPSVTVYLGDSELDPYSYSVYYRNNVNAGDATVVVEAVVDSGYTGRASTTFHISRRKLTKKNVSVGNFVYNGKYRKPVLRYKGRDNEGEYMARKLKLGKQYKIVQGSKRFRKIKKYTFVVQGKGNYKGKVKLSLVIRPKNPTGIKTAKRGKGTAKIWWKKQKGVTGYCVRTYNAKGKAKNHYTKKNYYVLKADKDFYVGARIYSYKKVGKKKIHSTGKYYYDYVKPTRRPSFSVTRDIGKYTINFKEYGSYIVEYSNTKDFKKATAADSQEAYGDEHTRYIDYYADKTEWFRVRRFVRSNKGKLLAGPWSKPRKVTVY